MKGAVRLPVFIDDARKYVNTTQLRAKYLGASYEAEYCQWQTLHGLGSLMETASLIITPNAYLEGKLIASYPPDPIGDFDVTRATTATRVNSAGLVELVPYNLAGYSEQFDNAYWSLYQSTIGANAMTAPNGTLTADALTNTINATAVVYVNGITNLGTNTFSVYLKKGTHDLVFLESSNSTYNLAYFNLVTETIGSVTGFTNVTMENVGDGWFRCYGTFTNTNSTSNIAIGNANGSAGNITYIWGAQVVEGTLPKDYQKTETRLNIPRLDYSNGTCPSLLVEPQRTNYIWYSSAFDNIGAWGAIDTTITANTTISPNGIQNAETMTITSSTSRIFQTLALGAGTYTASIYVKSLSGTPTIQFRMVVDGTDVTQSIPTTTDWVRHDFTFTASVAVSFFVIRGESGTGSVAIWGAQLEAGNYSTSYIPTTSASVTRNADVVSKTGISSLIGQTEGTIFIDLDFTDASITMLLQLFDGSSDVIAIYTGGNSVFFDGSNGTAQWSISGSLTNGHHKLAIAYKTNDIAVYIDGVLIGTDTSAVIPTTDRMYLNGNVSGSFIEKQYYNATALWKTRLTNTQLQTLTSL